MGLVEHAEREMKLAGLYDEDSDYGGMIPPAVLALVRPHSDEGHSGFSHGLTLQVFNRVINFKTLTPITSDPEEWVDRSLVGSGNPRWQNRRDPSYFSNDGGKTWYCIHGEPPKETTNPEEEGFYWAKPPDGPVRVISLIKFAGEAFCVMNPGTDHLLNLPVEGWRFFGPLKARKFEEPAEEGDSS